MSNRPAPLLRTVGLAKTYFRGAEVQVLKGVDLELWPGEFVSIVGTSGSGKSTLLHLIGGLDLPQAGEIFFKEQRLDPRNRRFRDKFRNQTVGYVFQFYHLLPELTALENVMLPAMIELSVWSFRKRRTEIRARAAELLEQVGLTHRASHRPTEMSGGEMQRTAIARALMSKPELILADEPTGNLDFDTGRGVTRMLFDVCRRNDVAVLLVTHDQALADAADRKLRLVDGRIQEHSGVVKAAA